MFKVSFVKYYLFHTKSLIVILVFMEKYSNWDWLKKAEHRRIDTFERWG